jgi:hypothetical protein
MCQKINQIQEFNNTNWLQVQVVYSVVVAQLMAEELAALLAQLVAWLALLMWAVCLLQLVA